MSFTFLSPLLSCFLFPLLQKLISLEKIAWYLSKIKQMFPGLLFVFLGDGCFTRIETSCRVSDAFGRKSWGEENVYLLCIAERSQNVVFINREAKKTSPAGPGSGFTVNDSGFLQWHCTFVSSLHLATNFLSSGSHQWYFWSCLSLSTHFSKWLQEWGVFCRLELCDIFLNLGNLLLDIR